MVHGNVINNIIVYKIVQYVMECMRSVDIATQDILNGEWFIQTNVIVI